MSSLAKSSNGKGSSNGNGKEASGIQHRAAQYLQRLEDGRTFSRYAERAFHEAAELAPDAGAFHESISLRNDAGQLRRKAQGFKQKGLSRFNPKRRTRRVIIEKKPRN